MKKHDKGGHAAGHKPVADIVNALLEDSRKSRVDGPSSMLYGARAQLSTTLNQAGTLLAKIDREEPPAKPTLLQSVLGLAASTTAPKRRSWFFAAKADGGSLTAKRIEALLKETEKDGTRLSFEKAAARAGEDVHCVLPEGATDPVCEPRR